MCRLASPLGDCPVTCISEFGSSSLTYFSGIIQGRPKVMLRVLDEGVLVEADACYDGRMSLTDPEECSQTRRAFESRSLSGENLDLFSENADPVETQS